MKRFENRKKNNHIAKYWLLEKFKYFLLLFEVFVKLSFNGILSRIQLFSTTYSFPLLFVTIIDKFASVHYVSFYMICRLCSTVSGQRDNTINCIFEKLIHNIYNR